MEIIFENKDIIVINKEQGIPCQSDKTGDKDLYSEVFDYLNEPKYLALLHRLDRPVGGIILFAKNEDFAKIISQQISERKVIKKYTAIVCGEAKDEDYLEDYLLKNQRLNFSKIVNKNMRNAKKAELSYRLIEKIPHEDFGFISKIEIELFTGRHHQIRVQLANAGLPVYGDCKYNKYFLHTHNFVNTALFSTYFKFYNPKNKEYLCFEINPDLDKFLY